MILEVAFPIPLHKTYDYIAPPEWEALRDTLPGRRVRVPFGPRSQVALIVAVKEASDAPAEKLKTAQAFVDEEPVLDDHMLALGRALAGSTVCSLGEALFALLPPGRDNPYIAKDEGAEFDAVPGAPARAPILTPEQGRAVSRVRDAAYAETPEAFLLLGVAAAGKTEVYMALIEEVLEQGRSALYLAPEIGLAVQTARILEARFGAESVALWHSDMTPKKRVDLWWRVRRGEVSIVVGARSAALAPLPRLGAIIVDEEQDSAYREDRKPRFHARDVAVERARLARAVAVLGSATPSLESFHAANEGRLALIEINARATPAVAPSVRVIDVRAEKMRGLSLSPALLKILGERLKAKEQAILFLNRRGFHRFLICPQCSWLARCPACAVLLVHHRSEGLRCHSCGHAEAAPAKCPTCGHKKLHAGGHGTQRVEQEVLEAFPWARVLRWDRDAAGRRNAHEELYRAFSDKEADVLVGTQIVAQGFDFPGVTLVGVVDADSSLHVPDFRAAERTFQLLTQVAGRAGRALVTGDVIVQTRHPEHYAVEHAMRLDYRGFAQTELIFRQDLNYPPFGRIVRVAAGADKRGAAAMEALLAWFSGPDCPCPVGVLGPIAARRTRGGKAGTEVTLKVPATDFDRFLPAFRTVVAPLATRLRIYVDPA